jgi:hypothetical protein
VRRSAAEQREGVGHPQVRVLAQPHDQHRLLLGGTPRATAPPCPRCGAGPGTHTRPGPPRPARTSPSPSPGPPGASRRAQCSGATRTARASATSPHSTSTISVSLENPLNSGVCRSVIRAPGSRAGSPSHLARMSRVTPGSRCAGTGMRHSSAPR